ncbi:hypothetical protein [Planctomycetes bacterium Poly30]|uniref:hypothetical protein n=1 Tax=Saltatorellus ferox TaxID=2528018 RepID=UPI0011A7BDDE
MARPVPLSSVQEPVKIEAPKPVTQDEIDTAIHRAIRFLLSRQELDGSWRPDEAKYVSGQTGLCVYTLLKAGVEKNHPSIERGIAYLRAHPPEWTYGIACSLLALHELSPERFADEIEAWTAVLMEGHGLGFAYPANERAPNYEEDLSLTQYGALGLRVAESCGLKVHHTIWESLIDYAMSVHNGDGSFSYRLGTDHTGSMTAAGIAVLQISRAALEAQNRMGARESRQIQEVMDQAYEWLGENLRMDRNPDPNAENDNAGHMTRWSLYYLYGLERVGGLTGVRTFGGRDWYEEASRYLIRTQGGEGQWGTAQGEPHPGTCFGVLVLKRATAPTSGQKPRGRQSYGDDVETRPMSLRLTGDTPLTAWVSSFGTKTLKKFEWDGEIGKGPRVIRVEYFNDETKEILGVIQGDPESPSKSERFAAQFKLPHPGTFRVRARAFVRPISDTEGEEVLVLSQPVQVVVDAAITEGMRDAQRDLGHNNLQLTECEVRASSFATDGQKPSYAADGKMCYVWLSKPDDAERWIEIEPDRPQRGDHVVLTPALQQPDKRHAWGRPGKVFVKVNGKSLGEFEMNPDPYAKTYIPLKKKTVVREIRVEILETIDGKDGGHGKASGFAEIELQLRQDFAPARKGK